MTESQKLEKLKALSGESDEILLSTFLDIAGERILHRLYPFKSEVQEIPECYHLTQIDIAVYLLNKRGAEGETAHSENGISRSYESASVPESMLKHITPYASPLGGTK